MATQQERPEIQELNKAGAVLRHLRMALRLDGRKIWELLSETVDGWFRDNAGRLGASLAFYTVFSLAPLLVVVVGVAGLALERATVQTYLIDQTRQTIGVHGAEAIKTVLQGMGQQGGGLTATIVGLITLFFGASLVVAELRDALNTLWGVAAPVEQQSLMSSIKSTLRERFFSFTMVLGIGFLLLVSLILNAWLAAMGKHLQNALPLPPLVLQAVNLVLWLAVTTVLFGLIYRILPDAQIAWSDVAIGAIVTSILFTLGKTAIGLYLGGSGIASTYGAAGSLVILLAWVYYSAQVFFMGAEFTRVYANKYGSRVVARVMKGTSAEAPETPPTLVSCTGEPLKRC